MGPSAPKHQIKADRLIGNRHLHSERDSFYQALVALTVGSIKRPIILVDWSNVSDDRASQKLRALMAVEGRALRMYEEVHPQCKSANRVVQAWFLKRLHRRLPDKYHPIIVTDSGFKNSWFNEVKALGWDFFGRVEMHIMVRGAATEQGWMHVERIFEALTKRARYYGEVDLACPLRCYAYTLKRKPAGRVKKTHFGKKSAIKRSLKNAHRERTPRLLVTSLEGGKAITKSVIQLYQFRMQIEEALRDLKNHRFGFSFRHCMKLESNTETYTFHIAERFLYLHSGAVDFDDLLSQL